MSKSAKKMRIGTMVTSHFTAPPPGQTIFASMDIALRIITGVKKHGHEVTLYAPVGSTAIPEIITANIRPLKQDWGAAVGTTTTDLVEKGIIEILWDQLLLARLFQDAQQGKFDVLHIHLAESALPLALTHPTIPVIYTLHDPIKPWKAELYRQFSSPNQHFISISNAQRQPAPDLNYLATIHHGIESSQIPFSEKTGSYLLFVGRIFPEKGVKEAIEVALKTKERLVIIGPVYESDQKYYEQEIKPHLGPQISHHGYMKRENIYAYYQEAKATLFPIQWNEPLGLVMLESMACGTPVIAFRRGSVPEVIIHEKTGFIVDTIDQMTAAVSKISSLNRADCRVHIEQQFGFDQMINQYAKAYQTAIL